MFEHRAVVLGPIASSCFPGWGAGAKQSGAAVIHGNVRPGARPCSCPRSRLPMARHGQGLHAAYPVFAEAFNSVVAELDRHLLRPLREVMWGHDENLLNTTEFAQPALFAMEVALFRLLESWVSSPIM
ncbi:acyl transferase domain protein [Mycobacterium xenopi 4042]|uniref:Acyl transferase domain protein n=1 Tax=Mycobacterium xenopi 4042 TaxID=1299334 RepID=X7Z0V9_MYCXE|nr:acyl transferase domain protein [Mycobacterium xenopi 4042]